MCIIYVSLVWLKLLSFNSNTIYAAKGYSYNDALNIRRKFNQPNHTAPCYNDTISNTKTQLKLEPYAGTHSDIHPTGRDPGPLAVAVAQGRLGAHPRAQPLKRHSRRSPNRPFPHYYL